MRTLRHLQALEGESVGISAMLDVQAGGGRGKKDGERLAAQMS